MIIRIDNEYELRNVFESYDRDCYTLNAYRCFLDWYSEDYELDVVEICGEWDEYDEEEIVDNYNHMYSEEEYCVDNDITLDEFEGYKDEYVAELISILEQHTTVENLFNGNYLIANF